MRQIAIKILSVITILLSMSLLITGLLSLYYRINEIKFYVEGLWECETILLCILTIFSALILIWVAVSLSARKQYHGSLRVFFIISSFIVLAVTIFNLHHDIGDIIRGYILPLSSLFLDIVYMSSLVIFLKQILKPDEIRIAKKLAAVILPYLTIISAALVFFNFWFLLNFILSPQINYYPSVYWNVCFWYYSSAIISIVIAVLLISHIKLPKVLQISTLIIGIVPFRWAAYLLYEKLFEIYDIYDFLVILGSVIVMLTLIIFGLGVIIPEKEGINQVL